MVAFNRTVVILSGVYPSKHLVSLPLGEISRSLLGTLARVFVKLPG